LTATAQEHNQAKWSSTAFEVNAQKVEEPHRVDYMEPVTK